MSVSSGKRSSSKPAEMLYGFNFYSASPIATSFRNYPVNSRHGRQLVVRLTAPERSHDVSGASYSGTRLSEETI